MFIVMHLSDMNNKRNMYSLGDIHAERMVMKSVTACYLAWYEAETIKVELHGLWRHGYFKECLLVICVHLKDDQWIGIQGPSLISSDDFVILTRLKIIEISNCIILRAIALFCKERAKLLREGTCFLKWELSSWSWLSDVWFVVIRYDISIRDVSLVAMTVSLQSIRVMV